MISADGFDIRVSKVGASKGLVFLVAQQFSTEHR